MQKRKYLCLRECTVLHSGAVCLDVASTNKMEGNNLISCLVYVDLCSACAVFSLVFNVIYLFSGYFCWTETEGKNQINSLS